MASAAFLLGVVAFCGCAYGAEISAEEAPVANIAGIQTVQTVQHEPAVQFVQDAGAVAVPAAAAWYAADQQKINAEKIANVLALHAEQRELQAVEEPSDRRRLRDHLRSELSPTLGEGVTGSSPQFGPASFTPQGIDFSNLRLKPQLNALQFQQQGQQQGLQIGQPQGLQIGQPQGLQIGQPQGLQIGQPQGLQIGGQSQGLQIGQPQGLQIGQLGQQPGGIQLNNLQALQLQPQAGPPLPGQAGSPQPGLQLAGGGAHIQQGGFPGFGFPAQQRFVAPQPGLQQGFIGQPNPQAVGQPFQLGQGQAPVGLPFQLGGGQAAAFNFQGPNPAAGLNFAPGPSPAAAAPTPFSPFAQGPQFGAPQGLPAGFQFGPAQPEVQAVADAAPSQTLNDELPEKSLLIQNEEEADEAEDSLDGDFMKGFGGFGPNLLFSGESGAATGVPAFAPPPAVGGHQFPFAPAPGATPQAQPFAPAPGFGPQPLVSPFGRQQPFGAQPAPFNPFAAPAFAQQQDPRAPAAAGFGPAPGPAGFAPGAPNPFATQGLFRSPAPAPQFGFNAGFGPAAAAPQFGPNTGFGPAPAANPFSAFTGVAAPQFAPTAPNPFGFQGPAQAAPTAPNPFGFQGPAQAAPTAPNPFGFQGPAQAAPQQNPLGAFAPLPVGPHPFQVPAAESGQATQFIPPNQAAAQRGGNIRRKEAQKPEIVAKEPVQSIAIDMKPDRKLYAHSMISPYSAYHPYGFGYVHLRQEKE